MSEYSLHKLKIDMGFKNLIRPLTKKEFLQLEENILTDGCIDPIITWNGYIIDGHNRYEICTKHRIPFRVKEKEFDCREAVVAWICAHQLGRRNISEETRKFLIGMQYESEKTANEMRNANGVNQYTPAINGVTPAPPTFASGHRTAERIGRENHVSWGTVRKYSLYAQAIMEIGKKAPDVVPKILGGQYKISHKNLEELASLTPSQIEKVMERLESDELPFVRFKKSRTEIKNRPAPNVPTTATPSVKDMPEFDPDAEITSLALTIPSWTNSIDRTKAKADLSIVSEKAKENLEEALFDLIEHAESMLSEIEKEE